MFLDFFLASTKKSLALLSFVSGLGHPLHSAVTYWCLRKFLDIQRHWDLGYLDTTPTFSWPGRIRAFGESFTFSFCVFFFLNHLIYEVSRKRAPVSLTALECKYIVKGDRDGCDCSLFMQIFARADGCVLTVKILPT